MCPMQMHVHKLDGTLLGSEATSRLLPSVLFGDVVT